MKKSSEKIKVLISGLPGKMALAFLQALLKDKRFKFLPYSLTGPDIEQKFYPVGKKKIRLIHPDEREEFIVRLKKTEGDFIIVDYTHPTAVNSNAEFYCKHKINFVMGTTGGQRDVLNQTVESSEIAAVIAPNMAKQIVGFMAMMKYLAENFPNLFAGYKLVITESHQKGKADTSGTAKAMVEYFNQLGIPFTTDQIVMIRDNEKQRLMGIPEEYWGAHGWHNYKLISPDGTVFFEFTHNVNGREIYALGTLDIIVFLVKMVKMRKKDKIKEGKVYSIIDGMKG